jgi:serine/threonine protein phosphatase PrpC
MSEISNVPAAAATTDRPHRVLTVCGGTNVGAEREENQDTFVIADLESGQMSRPCIRTEVWVSRPGLLMLVCDGSGPAEGDGAAQLAAASIKHRLQAEGDNVGQAPGYSLKRAVLGANKAILAEAKTHPAERGMETTCTAAIASPDRLAIAQVGDSRAYLLREGRLHVLTRDQTLAADLIDAGVSKPSQAEEDLPSRHILTQTLGTRTDLHPVITDVELCEGDRVLLCSDGLHGPVADETIAEILAGTAEVADVSQALIAAALAAGGSDNVTVVVADCGPLKRRPTPTPTPTE